MARWKWYAIQRTGNRGDIIGLPSYCTLTVDTKKGQVVGEYTTINKAVAALHDRGIVNISVPQ